MSNPVSYGDRVVFLQKATSRQTPKCTQCGKYTGEFYNFPYLGIVCPACEPKAEGAIIQIEQDIADGYKDLMN